MDFDIRLLATEEEFRAFLECDAISFAGEVREDEVPLARAFCEPGRTMAAFDGDRLVGTCANLTMELTVPGPAVLPCAGVTWVSVLPSHRRRGILTAMMERLLDDAEGHGEPAAVLLASEGAIYGRFGYGLATQAATYQIDKRHAVFARRLATDGSIRVLMPGEAGDVLPAIHDANRREVPGNCSRSAGWWGAHLHDAAEDRDGASRLYHAVHEPAGSGSPDGYVSWRIEHHWEANPDHVALVVDHSAVSDEVRLTLLEFVCRLDLVGSTRLQAFPVDEPLRWTLTDPRRLTTRSVHDVLWVRILDVGRCLTNRTYTTAERLVIDVDDPFRPACGGRHVLDTRDRRDVYPDG